MSIASAGARGVLASSTLCCREAGTSDVAESGAQAIREGFRGQQSPKEDLGQAAVVVGQDLIKAVAGPLPSL